MSHWQKGKLSMRCSKTTLVNALTRLHPEWESHIQVAKEGEKLRAKEYDGNFADVDIIVKKGAPGVIYSDLFFNVSQEQDEMQDIEKALDPEVQPKNWEVTVDDLSKPDVLNIGDRLQAELGVMRVEMMEKMQKLMQMQKEQDDEGGYSVTFWAERDSFGALSSEI